MSTLPLDLVLHIVEVGDLDIKDKANLGITTWHAVPYVNYLPALLKFVEVEECCLLSKFKESQTRVDFSKASVLEHLLSNQLYNIGLENIRRINSHKTTPASTESVLFNLSLLESKSYRHFRNRRIFLKKKSELLERRLKSYVVEKYSTLQDETAKRQLYDNYVKRGLQLVLRKMEKRVSPDQSAIVEHFDVLKLYSGKCKAHPYLLFAVATKVVCEGWIKFGLKLPDLIEPPVCSPWSVIYQDTFFDYENSRLMTHKYDVAFNGPNESMSYLVQLFNIFDKVNGLRSTDFATIKSVRGFEDYCTDVNFVSKIKLSSGNINNKIDFNRFLKSLEKEDELLHQVVLEHALGVGAFRSKDELTGIQSCLRGHVIKTRHNKAAVVLSSNEEFCKVLTITGTIETIRSDFVRKWSFDSVSDVSVFIRMVGLNTLFCLGFCRTDVNLAEGHLVFASYRSEGGSAFV
ncbi:hypothetical protein KGF57_003397 [Candida theae]|uniref:Uncharacterized protein n=1 Tax=Candida theae TaxID=1198502 RepID=A0AAD5FXT6_9ASCO|nr:uncharacterized protein KGF57_003397 [Candida theae]KAI5957023.1 hypothetical protein KGF57_003397 [Candida theae]